MRKEYVYFILNKDNGLIKIGESHHPHVRVNQIADQVGAPLEVLATIPQPVPLEKLLHFKFAHLQERGEWFKPGDDLLELIETYKGRPDLFDHLPRESTAEYIENLHNAFDRYVTCTNIIESNLKLESALYQLQLWKAQTLGMIMTAFLLIHVAALAVVGWVVMFR